MAARKSWPKGIHPIHRVLQRVVPRTSTGCWEWQGKTTKGYGLVYLERGKYGSAHRVTYGWFRGPILAGLECDHLCRNKRCVNPWHIEAVTHTINLHRGPQWEHRRRGICSRGHAMTPDNSYTDPRGYAVCRTCKNASTVASNKRRAAERRAQCQTSP